MKEFGEPYQFYSGHDCLYQIERQLHFLDSCHQLLHIHRNPIQVILDKVDVGEAVLKQLGLKIPKSLLESARAQNIYPLGIALPEVVQSMLSGGIVEKSDLVIADSIEQCKDRGEIAHALKDGNFSDKNIVELGQVLSGEHPGREHHSQITIADLTGVAVQDIQIATAVFNNYMESKNEI